MIKNKMLLHVIVLLLLLINVVCGVSGTTSDLYLRVQGSSAHNVEITADSPTEIPSAAPTVRPSAAPTATPTAIPTVVPTTRRPTFSPSAPRTPTRIPTRSPTTQAPSIRPTTMSPTPVTFAPTDPYKGAIQLNFYSQLSVKGLAVAKVDKATIKVLEDTMASTLEVDISRCEYLDSLFTTVSSLHSLETSVELEATNFLLVARMKTKIITDYSTRDTVFLSLRSKLVQKLSSGVIQANFVSSRAKYSAVALNSATVTNAQADSTYSIQYPDESSGKDGLSNASLVGIIIGATVGLAILLTLLYNFCCFRKKSAKIGIDQIPKDEDFNFQHEEF